MAAKTKKPLVYFFDPDDAAVQAESSSNVQSIDDKTEGDLEAAPSDAQTMEIVKEHKSVSSSSSVSERYAFLKSKVEPETKKYKRATLYGWSIQTHQHEEKTTGVKSTQSVFSHKTA